MSYNLYIMSSDYIQNSSKVSEKVQKKKKSQQNIAYHKKVTKTAVLLCDWSVYVKHQRERVFKIVCEFLKGNYKLLWGLHKSLANFVTQSIKRIKIKFLNFLISLQKGLKNSRKSVMQQKTFQNGLELFKRKFDILKKLTLNQLHKLIWGNIFCNF